MNPSLECELARVQMKRYLGGEELPPKLMEELEQHVRACSSCSHYLDTQKLKLAAKLSGSKQESVKAAPAPKGPKDSDVFTKPRQAWLTPKTLGLAAALALVLFAMSAVAKDPTILFGPKASAVRPSAEGEAKEGSVDSPGEEADGGESHKEEAAESESEGHGQVGKIMTGETVQKEIEDSLKHSEEPESHDSSDNSEPKPEESQAKTSPGDSHESQASSEPAPKREEGHHKPVQPEPAPKMDLIVAEEGGSKKHKAPAPHPKVAPSSQSRRSSSVRRASHPRKPAPRPGSKPRSVRRSESKPSSSGSVRIYDANGAPINP